MNRKKFPLMIISCLIVFLLMPRGIHAAYVRENSFMDKKGSEQIAEIKKFQARMNLPVTGKLDAKTKKALHTENYDASDYVVQPPTSGTWIVVNKTRRFLTLYRGSQSIGKFPVTLGASATPTPSGKAKIHNKHLNPSWGGMNGKYEPKAANAPDNPLGERWMGLSIPGKDGYGIHGNIKPFQIGGYFSNGCIRMFNYDIETFVFPEVSVGTPVWIGTDQELESWGVYQYSRVGQPPTSQTPVEPAEPSKPQEPITVFETQDLLDF